METIFNYKNIRITESYSPLGRHVEAMIRIGDTWEIVNIGDPRIKEAFIAKHNLKCS